MTDHSQSSRFQELFERALQDYENQTGIALAEHPLAEQLQSCNSVDSILDILQWQAQAFTEFRGSNGRITKSLKSAVPAIHALSNSINLCEVISMPFPPATAIFSGIAVLFAAVKDVGASYDFLVDLLESIERFLCRLDIYTKISPTVAMAEIIVRILVELLSTLALATKQIKQKRPMKFVKKLLGDNEVEAVLQRLDRLTQDEARTTAAQTLEVVYGLMQNMKVFMNDGKLPIDTVRTALETMQQVATDINKLKRDELQHNIRKWLSPPDPWINHNTACDLRREGTATWFLQGDTFSQWKVSAPSSLLWIHGKPGAGKSIICSTIIKDINTMRKSGLASLAFFYCDFREEEKKGLRGLLSSLLVQLCHQSDSYCAILSKFYSEHENGLHQPRDDALIHCLKELLKLPGQAPIYLVLDALDECPDTSAGPSPREKVLMLVEELVKTNLPNVRICVTSRPEMDIKMALDPLTFRSFSLHDESGQMQDIADYIRWVIVTHPRYRRWKAEDKQMAIDILIRKANGMFRWVCCQVDYLRHCFPSNLRQALTELPETLDATYQRTLRGINEANWELAHRLLQCVAVASRPLRVEELAESLAFDFKAGQIPKLHVGWRPRVPLDAVLSTCSSLVAVLNVDGSSVVQFPHFSVKEFLTSTRLAEARDTISRHRVSLRPAHTLVAQACLGILLRLDEIVSRDSLKNFPLVEYAAQHWVDHARFEDVSLDIRHGIRRLFDPSERHFASWIWIYDPEPSWCRPERSDTPSEPNGTPLHYAALCGLHDIVEYLVMERSQDANSRGFINDETPLSSACRRGHLEAARTLLKNGADANARDRHDRTPLHWVLYGGHFELARLLLEYGANAITQDETKLMPLRLASGEGHAEVTRILLEYDVAQDMDNTTPLHRASQDGHLGVSLALLHRGADANCRDENNMTPLHLASMFGYLDVAQILLKYGAYPDARDESDWTPLHFASQEGYSNVVELLLGHNGDATVLPKTLEYGKEHEPIPSPISCRALLKAENEDQQTPLLLAATNGELDVVRYLLKCGAQVDCRDWLNRSPLHGSSENGHNDITKVLLKQGANANVTDAHLWTPLHMASRTGKLTAVETLLNAGAGVQAQNDSSWTSLHMASQEGHWQVVELLLSRGADAGTLEADDETSLHLAAYYGHYQVAELLIKHGANISAQNKQGKTPLDLASMEGHHKLAQFLREVRGEETTMFPIPTLRGVEFEDDEI